MNLGTWMLLTYVTALILLAAHGRIFAFCAVALVGWALITLYSCLCISAECSRNEDDNERRS